VKLKKSNPAPFPKTAVVMGFLGTVTAYFTMDETPKGVIENPLPAIVQVEQQDLPQQPPPLPKYTKQIPTEPARVFPGHAPTDIILR